MINNIIIDFDSTIINAEGIELIIRKALERVAEPERSLRLAQLAELTDKATNGDIPLEDAIRQRLQLTEITKRDVETVAAQILDSINPMVRETVEALLQRGKHIAVFSTSFDDLVQPVTNELNIPRGNVFANKLLYDDNGKVIGVDESNPLFLSIGKVFMAERLKSQCLLEGGTAVVGDGVTDLLIRKNNMAKMFVYFAGSYLHEDIRKQADFTVDRFDQLLPLFCSNEELSNAVVESLSMPNNGIAPPPAPRVVLLESIHDHAKEKLIRENFVVESHKGAWSTQELEEKARHANVLGIRSKTRISADAIAKLPHLWAIGAFCIGTDQIDLSAAASAGIPVFNAPYSNTRSVAELVVGETIMLMRRIFEKSSAAHDGRWLKTASGCTEIRGKTVGIVGYGHIGSQVSVLLENLGMSVIFHDIVDKLPLGNAKKAASLYDLLDRSDVVTLHVPETPETRNMIGKAEIKRMKRGAFLINCSRGSVVDLDSLRDGLDSGHLAGAAIDVFPQEPGQPQDLFTTPLQNATNVILTPHIGGSTKEAQENIAAYVSEKLCRFLNSGSTIGAVNFPEVELPRVQETDRILHIHRNVPGVLAKINSVFARRDINVEGQILQTKGDIGYLIVDVNRHVSDHVLNLMSAITETIKVRKIS